MSKFQSHRDKTNSWLQVFLKRLPLRFHAIFACACACACALVIIRVYHHDISKNREKEVNAWHNGSQTRRIAIIIPFLSTSLATLPSYFPIFLQTARGSASIIDFLIFHNGQLAPLINEEESTIQGFQIPINVQFINLMSMQNFTSYFMRVIDRRMEHNHITEEEKNRLSDIMSILLQKYPYILVEYKPAMGHIFKDFIFGYSHWGYSDFDIVFGDLPRWITNEELNDWDIVTYSYGDQDRVYLRGQFTFHKNVESINNIWRKCSHLSKMDLRYKLVLSGEDKLQLVSAEGCYSSAVINTKNISVKYAVKAMSDVKDHNDASFELGIAIASGMRSDKSIVYKAPQGPLDLKRFQGLSYTWFENDEFYNVQDLQFEQGPRHLITEQHKQPPGCMYWVNKDYQTDLCYLGISSADTVMLVKGKLYKQSYTEQQFPHGVISKAFFHFQDWKRSFTSEQVAAFYRKTMVGYHHLGWQLFQEGAVEVVDTSIQETSDIEPSARNHKLPSHYYCLSSEGKAAHSAKECDYAISWRHENVFVNASEDWYDVDESDVTLLLLLKAGSSADSKDRAFPSKSDSDGIELEILLKVVELNVSLWQDSPVVIIVYSTLSGESKDYFLRRINELLSNRSRLFVGVVHGQNNKAISSRALSNMAESACMTRWIVSGIDVNQGITISRETLLFCKRAMTTYGATESNVGFVLGQMFPKERKNKNSILESSSVPLYSFSDLSELHPVPGNEIQTQIHQLWMEISINEINYYSQKNRRDPHYIISLAAELQRLYVMLSSALTDERLISLHFSKEPILLLDFKDYLDSSPQVGDMQQDCLNGVRLARLALMDHAIIPVPGAFVVYPSGNDKDPWHTANYRTAACKSLSPSSSIKASIVHTAKITTLRDVGSKLLSPYQYVA